jgi:hypothetical protein
MPPNTGGWSLISISFLTIGIVNLRQLQAAQTRSSPVGIMALLGRCAPPGDR